MYVYGSFKLYKNGSLKMHSYGILKLCSIIFAINQLFIVYNLLFTIYIVWVY